MAMVAKRSSIGGEGEPYQVYSEIVNAGKNLQGSKRKIKWLFGYTGSNTEHEIILLHSLVTGKKTITENGIEIVSASSLLAQDFSHGWQSSVGNRIYRIEATIGVASSEHLYIFSIDGIKYSDFPYKDQVQNRPAASVSSPSKSTNVTPRKSIVVKDSGSGSKAPSLTSASSSPSDNAKGVNRGNFQSPTDSHGKKAFDPFDGTSEPFDPFSDSNEPADPFATPKLTSPPTKGKPPSAAKARTPSITALSPPHPVARQEVNLFDDPQPQAAAASHSSSLAAIFDPFEETAAPAPVAAVPAFSDPFSHPAASTFDPFASNESFPIAPKTAVSSAADPFAVSTHNTNSKVSSFDNSVDIFAAKRTDSKVNILDLFGPSGGEATHTQTKTALPISASNSSFGSSFDDFDSAPNVHKSTAVTNANDGFSSTQPSQDLFSNGNGNSRRNSAIDLFASEPTAFTGSGSTQWVSSTSVLSDLAGLTFEAPFDKQVVEGDGDSFIPSNTESVEPVAQSSAVNDPWKNSNLVDLDLSGKNKLSVAKKPLNSEATLNSILLGSASAAPAKPLIAAAAPIREQQPVMLNKFTGLSSSPPPPINPFGGLSQPPLPPQSFPTGTGLAPVFPPPLPGSGIPSFQPPVYGRGLSNPPIAVGNNTGSPPPPSFGYPGTSSPPSVQLYGTGLLAPSSNAAAGFGTGAGSSLGMGFGGNPTAVSGGLGFPPNGINGAPGRPPVNPIMAGGKGNNIVNNGSSSAVNSGNNTSGSDKKGKDILTFNGLGIIPSPSKITPPPKSSLDTLTLNWHG